MFNDFTYISEKYIFKFYDIHLHILYVTFADICQIIQSMVENKLLDIHICNMYVCGYKN